VGGRSTSSRSEIESSGELSIEGGKDGVETRSWDIYIYVYNTIIFVYSQIYVYATHIEVSLAK
jgi:hypothetical protein